MRPASLFIPLIPVIFVLSLFPAVLRLSSPPVALYNWLHSSLVSVPPKDYFSSPMSTSAPVPACSPPSTRVVSTSSTRVLE